MHAQVLLRPDVILGEFGATIHAAEGALELHSTMKLMFDDQAPIRVKGRIKGSAIAAEGELYVLTQADISIYRHSNSFTGSCTRATNGLIHLS
jgi:hypothetical protein